MRLIYIRNWLFPVMLALGLAHAVWLILLDPVIGYANNYDFIRQSACVGIWHNHPETSKVGVHITYPAESFIYDGDTRPDNCEPGSDLIFISILARLHTMGDVIPRWQLGALKLAAGVQLFILLLKYPVTPWQQPGALLLSLLGLEWGLMAYANTLYAEFSVLLAFVGIVLAGAGLLERNGISRRRYIFMLLFALVWLATTKIQWMIWAGLLAAGYVVLLCLQRRQHTALLLLLVMLCVASYGLLIPATPEQRSSSAHRANMTNTFLYTVLPAANDLPAALDTLGLPAHCAQAVGMNWYSPGMADNHPCPELLQLSRNALLPLFVQQPATLYTPLLTGIDHLQQPASPHLGIISPNHPDAQLKLKITQRLAPSYWADFIPREAFRLIVCMMLLAGPIAFLVLGWQLAVRGVAAPALYWLAVGGLTSGYSLFSSVFGDGYIELPRHAVLFWPGLYSCLAGMVFFRAGTQRGNLKTILEQQVVCNAV